jgi:hypothetical protein
MLFVSGALRCQGNGAAFMRQNHPGKQAISLKARLSGQSRGTTADKSNFSVSAGG